VIENFGNRIAEDIWAKGSSRKLPKELHLRAKVLLTILHSSASLADVRIKGEPPDTRLHKLKSAGIWALDIFPKSPWRITFSYKNGRFFDVEIQDYH
jgi:toxin HigB-1